MQSYIIKTKEGRTFIVQEKHSELAVKRMTDMGLNWDEIKLAGDNSGEYVIRKEGKDSAAKNASDPSYKFLPLSSKIPKWALGNVIALLIISGYWFNEIQINEQQTRNEAIQNALELADYSVYFGPPSKASIRVDSIETVNFTKVDSSEVPGKVFEMCITFRLEASQDGFYFENLYPSEQVCVKPSSWYSGWSDTYLKEEVKKLITRRYQ